MTFSEKLKQCRIMSDYEPKEMAALIGINVDTYRKYENGKSQPNVNTLKKKY